MKCGCKGNELISFEQGKSEENFSLGARDVIFSHFDNQIFGRLEEMW